MWARQTTNKYVDLISQLDIEHEWRLTPAQRREYADQIARIVDTSSTKLDAVRIAAIIVNLHLDGELVAALREQDHQEHTSRWTEWSQRAIQLLHTRFGGTFSIDAAAVNLEDLAQEAMHDLWNALGSYRFESRFHTWASTIISNRYLRAVRDASTSKRRGSRQFISLEALSEGAGEPLARDPLPPEEEVFDRVLIHLLDDVLAAHSDDRLRVAFHLSVLEDQPLRVIGEHLSLSVPRVHSLLRQALTLLRNEERVRSWQLE